MSMRSCLNGRGFLLLGLLGSACGVRVIGDLGASDGAAGTGAGATPAAGGAGGSSHVAGSEQPLGRAGEAAPASGGGTPGEAGAPSQPSDASGAGGVGPEDEGDAGGGGVPAPGVAGAAGESGAGTMDPLPPELTALPIAHFRLDECDGPALDARSEALGTRYGLFCVPGVPGTEGKSAWFSAAPVLEEPRRVEVADEPRFAFTHELTVAAWVKPELGPNMFRPIVGKWYSHDMFQLGIRQVPDGESLPTERWSFSIAEPEGEWGRPTDVISPDPIELGQWSHVAGVYRWSTDGNMGHITLYVNGKPVAESNTKIGTDGLQQSTRPLLIGTVGGSGDFVGAIDEVRLYDVALGPEIEWLYLDPAHP